MPTLKLTTRTLVTLKPTDKLQTDYWDDGLSGFGLRLTSAGTKTWIVRYRHNGRKRRLKLGTFPLLSLADARDKAKVALSAVSQGHDPAAIKYADRTADSFTDLAYEYLERHAKPNKKSWREDERALEKEIIPLWKNLKAKEISRRDVLGLLDDTVNRGAPVHANRVLALVRKVFNFGIQREVVVMNPCQAITRPTKEHARERVLSAEEIRGVWKAIEQEQILISSILKIYLITGQRGVEVRSMAWADLDLVNNWWTIPGSITKNALAHRVPLSCQALRVVKKVMFTQKSSPWIFPSPVNGQKHINNIQKALDRVTANSKVECVGHDFRRTAASYMGSLRVPRLVISKILNHVESGVTRVYDRHTYDAEKREALDRWGKHLDEILNEIERPGLTLISSRRGSIEMTAEDGRS